MSEVEIKTVPGKIRQARFESGLSQGQVARELGWHRPTVSDIESGKRKVKAEEVQVFAKLFNKPVEWFYEPVKEIPQEKYLEEYFRDKEGWECPINPGLVPIWTNDFLEVWVWESEEPDGLLFCSGENIEIRREEIFKFLVPGSFQQFKNIMDALGV
jgi:transcriptional regulator with XRE-family HTH domain